MSPNPPYRSDDLSDAAYQLRYGWTGWTDDELPPPSDGRYILDDLADGWETDGIRILESDWSSHQIQLTASARPSVSPIFAAQRLKGRLDYGLRTDDHPVTFRRNFALHTLGEVQRETLNDYVEQQVAEEQLADPSFGDRLERFTSVDPDTDLSTPVATAYGQYRYNLHLVLCTRERYRVSSSETLQTLHKGASTIAEAKGHRLSAVSVMPDHLHLAVGGDIEHAPEEIALAYMNNLAVAVDCRRFWAPSFYVGTVGEYDMDAVRSEWGVSAA